jgi:hypothetical protein
MSFLKNRKSNNPFFLNPGRTHRPRWAGLFGCNWRVAREKKDRSGLPMGPTGQILSNQIGTLGVFFPETEGGLTGDAGKRAALECGEEGMRGGGELQSGGGASPLPPRPGGSLRAVLERRERQSAPELGRLRRARTRKLLRGRRCLGGRGRWCEYFQEGMVAFYRREREHGVMGLAAGAQLVSAKEGEGRSGLWAEGYGGL